MNYAYGGTMDAFCRDQPGSNNCKVRFPICIMPVRPSLNRLCDPPHTHSLTPTPTHPHTHTPTPTPTHTPPQPQFIISFLEITPGESERDAVRLLLLVLGFRLLTYFVLSARLRLVH